MGPFWLCTVHAPCMIRRMGMLALFWSPDLDSPDAVAREMLKRWPEAAGPKPQPRTLGNRIRDLDSGENAWWVKGARRPVVRRLAQVLKLEDDDLEVLLRASSPNEHPGSRKLSVLGELKSLRLDQEDLFPGLPPKVLASEQWTRHWWAVEDRATRELVALWHSHRQRTAVIHSGTWDDAIAELPRSGRVLLILNEQVVPVSANLGELPNLHLCVLAPCQAPHSQLGWTAILDSTPQTWIEDLVAWVRPRGNTAGGLRKESALRITKHLTDYAQWLTGPRAALELCGLLEVIGFKATSPRDLARHYLRLSWSQNATALAPRRSWLQAQGAASLVALVEEATYWHGDRWFFRGLSRPEWELLAPAETHARGVEQAHARLVKAGRGTIDRTLREALLADLEPSPRFFIDDLCTSGILAPAADGSVRIEPRWLAGCLRQAALEDTRDRPWESWTERLTQPVLAHHMLGVLKQDWISGNFPRIDQILAHESDASLPHTIAVDLCLRAAGLARIAGAALSQERIEALWKRLHLIVKPMDEGVPGPLFSSSGEAWEFGRRGFAVSIALLSELLPAGFRGPYEALWQSGPPHSLPWTVLRPIDELFENHRHQPSLLDALLGLGARWLARSTDTSNPGALPEFMQPAWLVAQFLGETPSDEAFRMVEQLDPGLMKRHCELAGTEFGAFADRCWRCWYQRPGNREQHPWFWFARHRLEEARIVWPHLPADLILDVLREVFMNSRGAGVFPNAYQLLGREQWGPWFAMADDSNSHRHDHRAWQYMPEEILLDRLRRGGLDKFSTTTDQIIWLRMGDGLIEHLAALRQQDPKTAWRLIRNAPPPLQVACLDAVTDWLRENATDEQAVHASAFLESLVVTRSHLAPRAWAVLCKTAAPR